MKTKTETPYRAYWRYNKETNSKCTWMWSATFKELEDANFFVRDKRNSDEEDELNWKIMQGNRNIKVFD